MNKAISNRGKGEKITKGTLNVLGLLIYIFIIFSPVIAMIVETTIYTIFNAHTGWMGLIIPTGRRLDLFKQSVYLSAFVAFFSAIIGVLIASRLWEWRKGFGVILRWLVLLLLIIPPYIQVHSWSFFIDKINIVLESMMFQTISFQGFWPSCFVQIVSFLPITVGLSMLGMEAVDRELIDSARVSWNDFKVFTKIVIPLSLRVIGAGAGLVFLLSFIDYTIPSLLQVNVYPLEIFAEFSSSNEPARAFLLSIPLVVVAFIIFGFSQSGIKRIALSSLWNKRQEGNSLDWPKWFIGLQKIATSFLFLTLLVPLISLINETQTFQKFVLSVGTSTQEFSFSLMVSILSAVLSIVIALIAAEGLTKKKVLGKLWWLLVAIPMAVPAPLMGIGLVSVWNRQEFSNLYGTMLMPILASTVRFTTIAVLIIWVYSSRFDSLLMDAGRIFAHNNARYLLKIKLPMLIPGLISAIFIIFALSMGELGATLIVAPPGQATLTMKIYNYLHYGSSDTIAGLCLAVMITTLVSGIIGMWFLARRK